MHRFTQWFLYCSGGERSVKCVRAAFDMEANKEEQRGVARFLVAEGVATSHKVKMLWNAVILLRNNARSHTVKLLRDKLQIFGWEIFKHPPYIPYLSSCDFHIFGDLKKDFRGRRFHTDKEVQE